MPLVVAPIPVRGRHPLVRHTIERLQRQRGVRVRVICIGDAEDREVCELAGAEFYEYPNEPLGAKWQYGFLKAREHNPKAVLYIGSDDWVSDLWCATMLEQDKPLVGVKRLHCLDLHADTGALRGYFWPHYPPDSKRYEEAIGGGRLLRHEALDACEWQVFEPGWNDSMDWSMEQRVGHAVPIKDGRLVLGSISTNAWPVKHRFDVEARMPHVRRLTAAEVERVVTRYFPEVHHIFPERKVEFHGMPPLPHG